MGNDKVAYFYDSEWGFRPCCLYACNAGMKNLALVRQATWGLSTTVPGTP